MAKIHRVSRKPLYLILIFSLVVALGYTGFNYLYPSQSSQIMAITPTELQFGQTTISAIIRKDTPSGVDGIYVAILPDTRAIILDSKNLDSLVGFQVKISGYLVPPTEENDILVMLVDTIVIE